MYENGALKYRSSMVVILSTISDSHKLWIIAINSKKKIRNEKKNHEPSKPGLHIFRYEPDDHIHVLHK